MNTPLLTIIKPRLHLPVVRGVIERRLLVNFRCEPEVLARQLPSPFRPKLVRGLGMAGICMIRLSQIRPAFLPSFLGLDSENAAHRIAVEWDADGMTHQGVFIPRRDTDSPVNQAAGGRLFPGVHHAATFQVCETDNQIKIQMRSNDGSACVRVAARLANELPKTSVFGSMAEASRFFQGGSLGWSARPHENAFDGLELACERWEMSPLTVERIESSFFADVTLFPPGSVKFDSALLMCNLPHAWLARDRLTFKERAPA